MDPAFPAELVRRAWEELEPLHAMIYFAPEAAAAYESIGLTGGWRQYFGSRAAALGRVDAAVVTATFYNWSPRLVARAIPSAFSLAPPERILDQRLVAAEAALTRALGDLASSSTVVEAADLLAEAAQAAVSRPEGRPLFAAHAGLAWPESPLGRLFHSQTLLREFRGDGHIAALVVAGLDGRAALLTHLAATGRDPESMRERRGWTPEEWAASIDELRARGLLAEGPGLELSDAGRQLRSRVEAETDAAATLPYAALGRSGVERLLELASPLARRVIDAGLIPTGIRRA